MPLVVPTVLLVVLLAAMLLLAVLLLAVLLAAVLLLALALHTLAKIQLRTIETTSVRHADERVLGFTSSYVVPVVVTLFGGSSASTITATCALVALLAIIYIRAGLYHLNPALAVVGFRLYEVTATNGVVTMVLSRSNHIPQQGHLECRYFGDDVAIQLKGPKQS